MVRSNNVTMAALAPFHDRMPVILPEAMLDPWLDPDIKDAAALKPILGQLPSEEMQAWPVSKDGLVTRICG